MNDFWSNVFRYQRYFVTIVLGIFFALFGWLQPLFARKSTAIATIFVALAGVAFIALTLRAMLGLS